MKKLILNFFVLTLWLSCNNRSIIKESKIKEVIFKKTNCDGGTQIEITNKSKILYQKCFIDILNIGNVDTLHINSDNEPDFVCTLQMEDHFTICVLVSEIKSYKAYELTDAMDAQLYSLVSIEDKKLVKEFILKDIDGDGIKEILVNVISRKDKIIPIKNFSDTISVDQIRTMLPTDRGL